MPSEFDIIARYFTRKAGRPEILLGIGDDAAIIQSAMPWAVSTDTLVAGRHFSAQDDPADVGWKSLAVNLSDMAAMGAKPVAFTLSLTLPETDETWLEGFARGMFELADQYAVDLIGGDTTRGALSISMTTLGAVDSDQALRRDGAQAGDLVCVTGMLGDAALALRLGADAPDTLARRLSRPQPRIAAGLVLKGVATAAIDISDGLAADLGHILEASDYGAELDLQHLPRSADFQRLAGDDRDQLQLTGGDDYELCFCIAPDSLAQVNESIEDISVIGRITEQQGLRVLNSEGVQVSLSHTGYDHFG